MIRVVCPGCEKGIKVPPEMTEAPFACPGCGTAVDPQQHRQVESKPEPAKPTKPEAPPIVISTAAATNSFEAPKTVEQLPSKSSTQPPGPEQSTAWLIGQDVPSQAITIVGLKIPAWDLARTVVIIWLTLVAMAIVMWLLAALLFFVLALLGVSLAFFGSALAG